MALMILMIHQEIQTCKFLPLIEEMMNPFVAVGVEAEAEADV